VGARQHCLCGHHDDVVINSEDAIGENLQCDSGDSTVTDTVGDIAADVTFPHTESVEGVQCTVHDVAAHMETEADTIFCASCEDIVVDVAIHDTVAVC